MLSILPNHLDLTKEFPANFVFVVLQHSSDKYVSLLDGNDYGSISTRQHANSL